VSLVKVQGNASGTGIFTVAAPNSNTDRTLTLPDSTGTIATAESTLSQFNVSGSAPVYACRAWVNFNGTSTVAIRASGNVSSITDNGTGDYTVNFTSAMPDANYSCVTTAAAAATEYPTVAHIRADVGGLQTGSARFLVDGGTSAFPSWDSAILCVQIVR
jgi:hypothetical protein